MSEPWWVSLSDELLADALLDRVPVEVTAATAAFLWRVLDLAPGARVFDQCAGLGRVSLALARLGASVVGIELAPGYVGEANARARAEKLSAEYRVADAFEAVVDPPADGGFNWWTGFGYAEDDAHNLGMLTAAFRSLKPGARFVLDVPNLAQVLRGFQPAMLDRVERRDGVLVLVRESRVELARGTLWKRWTYFLPSGERRTQETRTRLYLPHALAELLAQAGFAEIDLLGSERGEALSLDSPRCIAVARRPA